ncbi:MAG: hypothetical protein QW035_00950 [Candidatus Anstonellales archaeon]
MATFEAHLEKSLCKYFGQERGLELSKRLEDTLRSEGIELSTLSNMKITELIGFVAHLGVQLGLNDKEKGMLLDSIGDAKKDMLYENALRAAVPAIMARGSQFAISPEDREKCLKLAKELEEKYQNGQKALKKRKRAKL